MLSFPVLEIEAEATFQAGCVPTSESLDRPDLLDQHAEILEIHGNPKSSNISSNSTEPRISSNYQQSCFWFWPRFLTTCYEPLDEKWIFFAIRSIKRASAMVVSSYFRGLARSLNNPLLETLIVLSSLTDTWHGAAAKNLKRVRGIQSFCSHSPTLALHSRKSSHLTSSTYHRDCLERLLRPHHHDANR